MEFLISLLSGAIGGNVAGGVLKNLNLGTLGNSIAGIVGGDLGGQLLGLLGAGGVAAEAAGGLDIATLLSQVATGGVGGAALMAVIGAIKQAMAK